MNKFVRLKNSTEVCFLVNFVNLYTKSSLKNV